MKTETTPNPQQIWSDLMVGNERFRTGQPRPRDLRREREAVAQSQRPKALVLACSDSRVSPEIIFDQCLGDLFVVRIAGNVIDKLALGSLEFGAEELGVSLLVVIGHQSCGGVKAACSSDKAGSPNLKAIVKAIRASGAWPSVDPVGDASWCEAVKENARYVARSVLDRSDLLRDRAQRGDLAVVTAYYRLDTGVVERL
ncbi:MAG: carbonic anhydrase [Acidobacteriia bacterium]|nr:carbonic anhydrase [Terriglobia bacterium]